MADFDIRSLLKPEELKQMLKDPEIRKYVIGGGIFLFCLVYFFLILVPQFVGFAKISMQVSEAKNKLYAVENRIKRTPEMGAKSAKMKEEIKKDTKQLSREKEIPALLEWLATLARDSGVKIVSVTPGQLGPSESGSKYYKEMPVNITAKSGYHELGTFVSSLESGNRVVVIDNVTIQYDGSTPRAHNVNMVIKTYVSLE